MKDLLCNYKDQQKPLSTPGIYQVACKNCELLYRGQSRRAIEERIKEHCRATNNGQIWKSSVAEHMVEELHEIDQRKSKRLKYVRDERKLDAWESLYINTSSLPLMNREPAPILSYLFNITGLKIR